MLITVLAAFGLLLGTWLHYLAIMSLQRVRNAGGLAPWAYRFGVPILVLGYLLDFLSNMVPLTVLMLEPPREWLVSARVSRHRRESSAWLEACGPRRWLMRWRHAVSVWACSNLLDPFDPDGCHCK